MTLQIEAIGFVAGTLTTFCLLPQTLKIIRTHEVKAISISAEITLTLGCGLWAIYGMLMGSPSIITFNSISCIFATTIIFLKLHYKKSGTQDDSSQSDCVIAKLETSVRGLSTSSPSSGSAS